MRINAVGWRENEKSGEREQGGGGAAKYNMHIYKYIIHIHTICKCIQFFTEKQRMSKIFIFNFTTEHVYWLYRTFVIFILNLIWFFFLSFPLSLPLTPSSFLLLLQFTCAARLLYWTSTYFSIFAHTLNRTFETRPRRRRRRRCFGFMAKPECVYIYYILF